MNETLIAFAAAFTAAIIVSSVLNRFLRRRRQTPEGKAKMAALAKKVGSFFTRSIFGILGVGLVWTIYFMVVGLMDPAQSEWAANCATLIVSALTVFSIIIAFYEFLSRDKK